MARKLVAQPIKRILKVFKYTDFTGVGAVGTADFAANTLPDGCIVLGWQAHTTGAFSGDASAIIQVGVPGALAKFSARTDKSVFAAGKVNVAAPAATSDNDTLAQPRVTITSAVAWASVNPLAALTVRIEYLDMNAKPI